MLGGLQGLRAIAALSVAIYHGIYYAIAFGVVPKVSAPAYLGKFGVMAFFVLSGFLMARICTQGTTLVQFIPHRLLRIYPAFLCALLLTIGARWALSQPILEFNPACVLTLAPCGVTNYVLGIEWTLVYEVFFYVVVAALLLLPSNIWRQAAVICWLGAIIAANIASTGFTAVQPTVWQIGLSLYNLPFIIGMLAWWFGRSVPLYLLLLGAGACFAAEPLVAFRLGSNILLLACSSACLVLALATATATRISLNDKAKILQWAGDGSYGIYLLHVPVFMIVFPMTGITGVAWTIAVIAIAAVSGLYFGLLEFRIYRTSIKNLDRVLSRWSRPIREAVGW